MTPGPQLRWHVHPDAGQLLDAAVARLAQQAGRAIAARGRFVIVLSGGVTPRPLYAAAAHLDGDWSQWHVYFADERCLPAGHVDRNDTLARGVWLERVAIPEHQVHAIPAELGPEAAAVAYRQTLAEVGPFDLVLLGLGEDGHTASLFPGRELGARPGSADVLPVRAAPKPPPERVSLSALRLANARVVELLVLGREKSHAIQQLRDGADVPVRQIASPAGIDVFLDELAAGR